MKKYPQFVATGCAFGLAVEIQYRLLGRWNPRALLAAIVIYPILVSLAWIGGGVMDRWFHRRLTADIVYYFVCGFSGLAVEWVFLGNSPAANPNAFQVGMFSIWATFCFGPRLMVRDNVSTDRLRRTIWIFFGGYFALSTIFGLLIPGPQARFVVILLTSWAAYAGMNGLLLWLMVKQHRISKEQSCPEIPSKNSAGLES